MAGPWEYYPVAPGPAGQSDPWSMYPPVKPEGSGPGMQGAQANTTRGTPGILGPATDIMRGMVDQIVAGAQQTSPIVDKRYKKLGPAVTTDQGPLTGYDMPGPGFGYIDPSKQVVLHDPDTGGMSVYERSPETDESRFPSLGRVIGLGSLSVAPTRLAGTVGSAVSDVEQGMRSFNNARVPPTLAAVGGRGMRFLHNALRDFLPSASRVEKADMRTANVTGQQVGELAGNYGAGGAPDTGGAALKRGAEDFVTRFDEKAGKLWSAVDAIVPEDTPVWMGRTMRAIVGDPTATTARGMRGIAGRFDNPDLNKQFVDPLVEKWATIISEQSGNLTWNDARQLRYEIGKMLRQPVIKADFDRAQIERLYGALSEDLGVTAEAMGAGRQFQRANAYYRTGLGRINDALSQILKPGTSDEGAFAALMRTARGEGKGDIGRLYSIRRSMPADEWGAVASTVLRRLGEAVPSRANPDVATFSPTTFITRYNQLSDEARDVLFNAAGNPELRQALDDLVAVAFRQKQVEATHNTSRSAGIGAVGAVGAGIMTAPVKTILGLLGGNLAARALTNPAMVRWLTASAQTPLPQLRTRFLQLGMMAKGDPTLREYVQQLATTFGGEDSSQEPQSK